MQKVGRRQQRSGRPIKGEHSNAGLWRYIAGLDASVAWRVTAEVKGPPGRRPQPSAVAAVIVAWAVSAGLQVLVFEHLRPYRPARGLSWSRRTNRKRAYWLRGKVLAHVRHLALCHGILVVERNPAWTSQACPHCSHLGERFSPDGRGTAEGCAGAEGCAAPAPPSPPLTPRRGLHLRRYPSRFRCGHCGWTGDANIVAALNLKRKWDRTFRYPSAAEKRAVEPSHNPDAGLMP